jgi:rubredoxin
LLRFLGVELFFLYDVLCAKDFNPNERTGFVFSRNNPKFLLAEQLQQAISLYYSTNAANRKAISESKPIRTKEKEIEPAKKYVHQCKHCLSIYDSATGEPENGICAGTFFESLPDSYSCYLCDAPKSDFFEKEQAQLGLQAV